MRVSICLPGEGNEQIDVGRDEGNGNGRSESQERKQNALDSPVVGTAAFTGKESGKVVS